MPGGLTTILEALLREGVEFVVVGGAAAVAQGAPIVTQDLDLCYRRSKENVARLVRALAPFRPAARDAPPEVPFVFDERTILLGCNFTLTTGIGDIDLLGEVEGGGDFDALRARADALQVFGYGVAVMSLEDVIRAKERAGRPKDRAVLDVLRETLRERKRRKRP